MKYIGLTALCTALSMTGFYIFRQHGKKMKILKAVAELFLSFSQFVPLSEDGIAGCINRFSAAECFRELNFLHLFCEKFSFGCDVRKIWKESIGEDIHLNCLGEKLIMQLSSFCDYFGNIPMDVFCSKCEAFGEIFSDVMKKEDEKWEKNRSLIISSGILGAAAVFFIMI